MASPKIAISRYSSNGCQAHTKGPVWGGCWDASPLRPLVGQIISKSIYLFTLIDLSFHLKGFYFPHRWEDINPEINFSQMLHSARIYQLPLTNGLCCIQTTHTVQILHWLCYNTEFVCTERKASVIITFILGCKLTNHS